MKTDTGLFKNPCQLLQFHVEFSEACLIPFYSNTQVNLSYLKLIEITSEDICRVSAFLKEAGNELYFKRKA